MKRIGFVGLGNMGFHMVRNLLKAGFRVSVYDLRPAVMEELSALGAVPCANLRQVAESADIVYIMVMSFDQVQSVVLGEGGLLRAMSPGGTLVVCSTIGPAQTRSIARETESYGVHYADAPVSGGKDGAIRGTLVIMAACETQVFEEIRDSLMAMGSNTYHVSQSIGNGQTMKSINQMMISTGMAIAAEAVTMAVKSGLEPERIYEVIGKCTGCSDVFRDKLPLIMRRDFEARGPIDIFIKDLSIALDIGKEVKSPMFLSAVTKQLFTWASACGYGQQDLGALICAYEDVAGITVQESH